MRITDLMIGDYIQVKRGYDGHLTTEKVKGLIDDKDEPYPVRLSTGENVSLDDVVPIPLIEEILIKSGFEHMTKRTLIAVCGENCGTIQLTKWNDEYFVACFSTNEATVTDRVYYVHQLQNLFGIYNIEKEVKL